MGLFEKEEPKRVVLRTGSDLACLVCGSDKFFKRQAQLNTAMASFLNFDWLNPTGECCVCGRCGYIHWFLRS